MSWRGRPQRRTFCAAFMLRDPTSMASGGAGEAARLDRAAQRHVEQRPHRAHGAVCVPRPPRQHPLTPLHRPSCRIPPQVGWPRRAPADLRRLLCAHTSTSAARIYRCCAHPPAVRRHVHQCCTHPQHMPACRRVVQARFSGSCLAPGLLLLLLRISCSSSQQSISPANGVALNALLMAQLCAGSGGTNCALSWTRSMARAMPGFPVTISARLLGAQSCEADSRRDVTAALAWGCKNSLPTTIGAGPCDDLASSHCSRALPVG